MSSEILSSDTNKTSHCRTSERKTADKYDGWVGEKLEINELFMTSDVGGGGGGARVAIKEELARCNITESLWKKCLTT